MKFNKTRVVSSDVGRYKKVETGTANPPVKKTAKLSSTRVESGGVPSREPLGTNAKKGNTRMRKTRVTK